MPVYITPPRHRVLLGTPRVIARPPAVAGAIAIAGMQGLGDNLHQRAIVRQYMEQGVVYLETPWPSVYHDLVGPRLELVRRQSVLRTQAKNAVREEALFQHMAFPRGVRPRQVWYSGAEVRKHGSILGAMLYNAGCTQESDFRLPVKQEWLDTIDAHIQMWSPSKPIMLYRPLVERTEWAGCVGRNPDFTAYRTIFEAIRKHFFVVSVADLAPRREWIVGYPVVPDAAMHAGELPFELLAALAYRASLVYCSAGFAPLLGQAVGTPTICVFGGHESSMTISAGARLTSTLGIDPIVPCNCFDHKHKHQKNIDTRAAIDAAHAFIQDTHAYATRTEQAVAPAEDRLDQAPHPLHESGRAGGAGGVDRVGKP